MRYMSRAVTILVLLTASVGLSARQNATSPNPKPSQHGEVSQRVAGTTITLAYNRPVARGRELFGQLVPYGHVWCPCADDATTIALTTDVKVTGRRWRPGPTLSGRSRTLTRGQSSSIDRRRPGTRDTRQGRMRCASRPRREPDRTWRRSRSIFQWSTATRRSWCCTGAPSSCRSK